MECGDDLLEGLNDPSEEEKKIKAFSSHSRESAARFFYWMMHLTLYMVGRGEDT